MEQAWRAFGELFLLAFIAGSIFTAIYAVARGLMLRKRGSGFGRAFGEALFISTLVAALGLVAVPRGSNIGSRFGVDLIPFDSLTSQRDLLELVGQAVITFPLGFLATLLWPRLWRWALAVPIVFEVLQLVLPSGRVFSTQDILVGLAGVALGHAVAVVVRKRFDEPLATTPAAT